HADALGILAGKLKTAVRHGQNRGADAELGGPAHDFQALALLGGKKWNHIEVGDLGRDPDRMTRGVKRANGSHAAAAVHTRRPKAVPADAVGRDYPQAGDHHSAHGPYLPPA